MVVNVDSSVRCCRSEAVEFATPTIFEPLMRDILQRCFLMKRFKLYKVCVFLMVVSTVRE